MAGARPLALTLSIVLEEGLGADELRAEVEAIATAAATAGVQIVAGDTKVVERGHCDSDVPLHHRARARSTRARACRRPALVPATGSCVSGSIGEHGTAIMLARGEFELAADDPVGHAARCGRRSTR